MSDDRDPEALPRWEELLRQLEESHRRLESAHADYLEATAESQRALRRVVETFGDIADTVRALVPEPQASDQASPPEPPRPAPQAPATDNDSGGDEPAVESETAGVPSETPTDLDQSQNALPARLHSRGVPIPDRADAEPETPAEQAGAETPADTAPSRAPAPAVPMQQPVLIDANRPEPTGPFAGLDDQRRIVLTNDGFGVAPALNELLSQRGFRVRVESRQPELSAPADTVIFLGSLRAPSDLDDAMSVVDDAMITAERMTTRLMQPDSAFVSVIDTGGGFGLDDFDPVTAPYGSLLGLTRLLDRRHPRAATKLIDINGAGLSGDQIAERIADELLHGGELSPVALGDDQRRTVEFRDFRPAGHPAPWLDKPSPPLVYMPGADAVLATAVERLAIAHELPVAVLRRRHTPARIARQFGELGIDVRSVDYDLNRLFEVMDFLDSLRSQHGPIRAIIAESTPAKNPDELARWEVMRPPLDEFNALLAMTINDPLQLLAVGLGPNTPPVVSSALRYFARAESLRRNERLPVRLAHLNRRSRPDGDDFNPLDFALTEFLAAAEPQRAEVRFQDGR